MVRAKGLPKQIVMPGSMVQRKTGFWRALSYHLLNFSSILKPACSAPVLMYAQTAVNSENLVCGYSHCLPSLDHIISTANEEGRNLNLLQHLSIIKTQICTVCYYEKGAFILMLVGGYFSFCFSFLLGNFPYFCC